MTTIVSETLSEAMRSLGNSMQIVGSTTMASRKLSSPPSAIP